MLSKLRAGLERLYLRERGFASGKQFTESIALGLPPGSVVLDAGCGEARLRSALPRGMHYVGLDHRLGGATEYPGWRHRPTVVADLHALPFRDGSIRRTVLLHVLEHVRRPEQVLDEISRVTAAGAELYLAVPFVHELHHAPDDYFRFTKFGLQNLLDGSGFAVDYIRPTGGYYRGLAHVLGYHRTVTRSSGLGARALLAPLSILLAATKLLVSSLEYLLDLSDIEQGLVCGYVCKASKSMASKSASEMPRSKAKATQGA